MKTTDLLRRLPVFLFSLCPLTATAADPVYLELSSKGERVDLGLADARAQGGDFLLQAEAVREVLKKDLLFPKLFQVIEGGGNKAQGKAPLRRWADLGADVVATVVVEKSLGRIQLAGALVDVASGDKLLEKKFSLPQEGERAAGHAWADEVIRYFTGQPGMAGSRIVFVNDATGSKEVCAVDYDGSNFRRLTSDRSIALFPKASPDGKKLVFTTFKEGRPTIHVMDIDGRNRRSLCRYEGLNSVAAWMPEGGELVATLSLGRDPSLHMVDGEGRVLRTLTNAAAVDTAPAPSPDGLQVAFTSDRTGRPQIYVMNTSGANLRRLTFTDGQCDSPAWSPQGHIIAFTMSERGKNFDIHTVEVGTGKIERLTYGEGDNENAAWSPDGRWLVFTSSRRGKPELFIMGADGSFPRPVAELPGRSFTPHWTN
jgi:TolB protein